jgi:superfamily II DNA helicase RecQ
VNALAAARPASPHELLSIEGMGPSKIGKFGQAILELCAAR